MLELVCRDGGEGETPRTPRGDAARPAGANVIVCGDADVGTKSNGGGWRTASRKLDMTVSIVSTSSARIAFSRALLASAAARATSSDLLKEVDDPTPKLPTHSPPSWPGWVAMIASSFISPLSMLTCSSTLPAPVPVPYAPSRAFAAL